MITEIKLKGTVCHLDNKSEYNVAYRLKDDNQYGKTYEILYISRSIDTSSLDGQKEFLKVFLNENIVDKLFDIYGNDVRSILENKDIEKLKQINGIGEYKAKKIINEFNGHKNYELIYQELKDLNLTPKMVSKLVEYYKSPEIVVQTIKNDVYSLVNIDGIGFKKADEIAISSGIGFTDYRRIKGFILYYLKTEGELGKSYVTYNELCKAIEDNLGKIDYNEFNKSAKKLIDSKKIIVLDNGNKIALTEMYELEKNIYQELVRLNSFKKEVTQADIERVEKAIMTSEEVQGFSFTDEQKQAIKDSIYHNVIAITGGAGCVDCDTEFLSQNGWKKISDYDENDLVLQYNDNGTTEFVEPLRYIKRSCEFLNYVHNDALNMCVSDNHICYYMSSDNMLKSKPFDQIRELHYKEDRQGFGGKFLCGFNNLGIGLNISDDILRLYTIIIMRGKYISQDNNKYLCSIRVKELHNYKRNILVQSLNNLKIKFVERNKKLGFSDIIFYMNEKILDFPKEWYGLNSYQFNIVLDIIRNYSNRHNSYKSLRNDIHFTSQAFYNKSIADFVQFAIASTGHRGEIIEEPIFDNRYNDSMKCRKKYYVSYYTHCLVDFKYNCDSKLIINDYKTKDGYEYCFSVPSNKIILRRKNKIFMTGNCGKTTTANGIFKVFDRDKILACALSGKASVRISEATGLKAGTIHKTLGYNNNGFIYNDKNQFENCDCFLIDESTMVNGTLFLNVLKAIKTGTTVIMCGDIKQLTPIGNCQVFYDILKHSNMQIIELTKPHRQALKSGIITTSMNISNQIQILNNMDYGTKVLGELQDMVIKIQDSNTTIFNETIKSFKEEYSSIKNIIETQIVVAVKNRGQVSCYYINQMIKDIVNPFNEANSYIEIFSHKVGDVTYKYKLQVGDKIINTKNNYNCVDVHGKTTPIFNGNIGIIKKIDSLNGQVIIDFINIGEIIFEKSDYSNLELAYALTCHKVQGSGFDTVIVALDNNSYLMNYSEWLYTAITRAKKKCILVSTNSIINQTIRKKETKKKQTFLGEFF